MSRHKWIVFLLVLGALVVRLIGIDQPFIDPWSWRQNDVAAMARNFFENGFHFAWPQIDWAGEQPGYVGTEFPILPFAAALCYKVTGVPEWVGRMQGVLAFVVALPFFFLLVRQLFGVVAAGWATFFYAFAPLGIVASRAFMPDVPSLSLGIVGIYFFCHWIERNDRRSLIVSALLISLALLIKIPTTVIGAPLLYLIWRRFRWGAAQRWEVWLFAFVVLAPSALWYWHAHRIAQDFYPHHFFGGGGFRVMPAMWYWGIAQQTVRSSLTLVLFVLAIAGVCALPRAKYALLFHWWLAAMIAFIFIVGWGNRHQWYQLPLVPIAAALAGAACARVPAHFAWPRAFLALGAVLVTASFGFSSYFCARPFYRSAAAGLRNLGLELREATNANALIIAADDGDPTVFYYAHRKGWHFPEDGIYQGNPLDSAQLITNLEKLRGRGASHLVFYAGTLWWLDYHAEFAQRLATTATLVEKTPEFAIYKLQPTVP
ncbi:MAG: glycosyltransferase family 39 protein [Verrucomicrobiota bacterium]